MVLSSLLSPKGFNNCNNEEGRKKSERESIHPQNKVKQQTEQSRKRSSPGPWSQALILDKSPISHSSTTWFSLGAFAGSGWLCQVVFKVPQRNVVCPAEKGSLQKAGKKCLLAVLSVTGLYAFSLFRLMQLPSAPSREKHSDHAACLQLGGKDLMLHASP